MAMTVTAGPFTQNANTAMSLCVFTLLQMLTEAIHTIQGRGNGWHLCKISCSCKVCYQGRTYPLQQQTVEL